MSLVPTPPTLPLGPTTIAFDARYVNDRYHGIGRHAYNLVEALSRLDTRRRYAVYYSPELPNSRFDVAALGERENVVLRAVDVALHSPIEQVFWPQELERNAIALFHSPYVAVPVLPRVGVPQGPGGGGDGRPARPVLMTVHDLILELFPEYAPGVALRHLYGTQTRLGVRRAAAVLTVSEASAQDIERFYPEAAGKIRVIGNAVDERFRPVSDAAELERVRRRYELPPRFILTVGAARPHKNVGVVLEALAQLEPAFVPALVIAGETDERFEDEIARRTAELGLEGRVHRPGQIEEGDLPALYSAAEAFVFPSLVEGFGLPPLEAMACGTPVLASNASSVPEVVGEAAVLFDPRDATELSRQVLRLLSDSRRRDDLRGRGAARARRFTWDGVARAVLETYAQVLGDGLKLTPAFSAEDASPLDASAARHSTTVRSATDGPGAGGDDSGGRPAPVQPAA